MRRIAQKILSHLDNFYYTALGAFVGASCYFCSVPSSYANTGDTNAGVDMCNLLDWAQSDFTQDLSILAVMVLGVGAMLGKVSWGMAILVGVGIAVVFNVQSIANALGVVVTGCGTDVG